MELASDYLNAIAEILGYMSAPWEIALKSPEFQQACYEAALLVQQRSRIEAEYQQRLLHNPEMAALDARCQILANAAAAAMYQS